MPTPISQKDINCMFSELFAMQMTGNYIFRGISKEIDYQPTVFRIYEEKKDKIPNFNKYEMGLLEQYGKYSSQYLPNVFTPLDWVASAQHFGLPTRLIDWTFDPFCALYFALSNKIDRDKDKGEYTLLVVNRNEHLYFEEVLRIPMKSSTDSD